MTAARTAAELEALEQMSHGALAERWTQVFGCPAPGCRSAVLRLALGWQLQMVASRPATAAPERLLKTLRVVAPTREALPPGSRLVREWKGRTHHVTVLNAGFEHDGQRYRTLSAVARHITGTRWSGPVFFGLRA